MDWMEIKPAAKHACQNYRDFLELIKSGQIRSIRRGRKYLTTTEWVDNYLLSLEEKCSLVSM